MNAAVLALQSDGVSFERIVRQLPHDAGALVVYSLLLGFIFLIWYGSRRSVAERLGQAPAEGSQSARGVEGEASRGRTSAGEKAAGGSVGSKEPPVPDGGKTSVADETVRRTKGKG